MADWGNQHLSVLCNCFCSIAVTGCLSSIRSLKTRHAVVTETYLKCTAWFNIQQFYVLPTQCICVFCVDLRTNSDYCPIQD